MKRILAMTDSAVHRFHVRVYYEDTDSGGIVYYANYLRFAERARTEMLRAAGIDHGTLLERDGLAFAVRYCGADYLMPARLDDELCIHSTVCRLGGASMEMRQVVWRDRQSLCDMTVKLVCMRVTGDRAGRPLRIPDDVRNAVLSLVA